LSDTKIPEQLKRLSTKCITRDFSPMRRLLLRLLEVVATEETGIEVIEVTEVTEVIEVIEVIEEIEEIEEVEEAVTEMATEEAAETAVEEIEEMATNLTIDATFAAKWAIGKYYIHINLIKVGYERLNGVTWWQAGRGSRHEH